jgi:DNA repair protein RadC
MAFVWRRAIRPDIKDLLMGDVSLMCRDECGNVRDATAEEVLTCAKSMMEQRVRRGTALSSPALVYDYLVTKLGALEHEVFAVLLLDSRNCLIEFVELFRGTVDGTTIYPREVVKLALTANASSVILAHPHPSGIVDPSKLDEQITRRLRDALNLIDVRLVDHLIIVRGTVVSFAERGLL